MLRSPTRFMVIFSLLVLCLIVPTSMIQAADGSLNFTVDCAGFTSNGSELVLTRDNTGQLSEAFTITAIDGAGNTILDPISDVFFVGGSVIWDEGTSYEWSTAPLYNPLRLQIVSPAGNGLGEELVYENITRCPGLGSFGAIDVLQAFQKQAYRLLTGEAFVLQAADGETSDALELNAVPPRPINPPVLLEEQPGYAVVNTDNLYLRSGDDQRYSVIGIVDGGTLLAVLGRNEDRTWWYVQVGGLRGWVKSEFLVLRGNLTGVPEVPVLGEYTQPSLYVGYVGNPVFNLPTMFSGEVCRIPGNRDFAVIARTAASDWFLIEVPCGETEEDFVLAWIQADRGLLRNPGSVFIPVRRS